MSGGAVDNNQVIILDESLLNLPPLMEGCDVIFGSGSEVFGFKNSEVEPEGD